jgi:hypothetical protein
MMALMLMTRALAAALSHRGTHLEPGHRPAEREPVVTASEEGWPPSPSGDPSLSGPTSYFCAQLDYKSSEVAEHDVALEWLVRPEAASPCQNDDPSCLFARRPERVRHRPPSDVAKPGTAAIVG